MAYTEPLVERPDPLRPVVVTRAMRVRNQRITLRCVVIVNRMMYIADQDIPGIVRRGNVLVLQDESASAAIESQRFKRFRNLYELRRAREGAPYELVSAAYLEDFFRWVQRVERMVYRIVDIDSAQLERDARIRALEEAMPLRDKARFLGEFPRPFQRIGKRAADDLTLALRFLDIPGLGDWREAMRRVRGSLLLLLEPQRRLEEARCSAARLRATPPPIPSRQHEELVSELRIVNDLLDPALERGYRALPVTRARPDVARVIEILRSWSDTDPPYDAVDTLLSEAAARF